MKRATLLLSLSVLALVAVGAVPAFAATTRVVDNTPASICIKATPNVAGNYFTTIQAAVNASNPNDTVLVCPGTYEEQVLIQKNTGGTVLNGLRLRSTVTHGATIDYPSSDDPNSGDPQFKNIVTVSQARKTEVSRFKVTGPGPSNCDSIHTGIRVRDDADSKVLSNQVLNIRDDPFSGCQNGQGIQFGSFDESTNTSTDGDGVAQSNEVSGYQKTGIIVDEAGSNVLVDKNTVSGPGRTDVTATNGIQIGYDALAKVTNNKINGNFYTGSGTDGSGNPYTATGLLTVLPIGSGIQLSGNVLTNNQVGNENYGLTFASILNNRASGGDYGFYNDSNSNHNKYDRNRAQDNTVKDCQDDSTGTGTSGTANTWTRNIGTTSQPLGICNP